MAGPQPDVLLQDDAATPNRLWLRTLRWNYHVTRAPVNVDLPTPISTGEGANFGTIGGDFAGQIATYTLVGVVLAPAASRVTDFELLLDRTMPSNPPVLLTIGTEADAANRHPRRGLQSLAANSGASQANPNRVEVADTAGWSAGDRLTVYDDDTATGEDREVTAVTADDYLTVDSNLANDYTTAQNAKVFKRPPVAIGKYNVKWGKGTMPDSKEVLVYLTCIVGTQFSL